MRIIRVVGPRNPVRFLALILALFLSLVATTACRGADREPPGAPPTAALVPAPGGGPVGAGGPVVPRSTIAPEDLPVGRGRLPSATPPPGADALRAPGTNAMVARLEALRGGLDPRRSVYLAQERVAMLRRSTPDQLDQRARLNYDSLLALELIGLGEFEEAAGLLRGVRTALLDQPNPPRDTLRDLASLLAITYLRLGEQANCVGNHNADSCLLPIQGGGIHVDGRGSSAATAELEALLAAEPDDLVHRWLLNIAAMTLGTWPDSVPERWRIAEAAFESDTAFPRFLDIAPALGVDVPELAGGVVLDDLDADGDLDLMVSSWGERDQLRYFENQSEALVGDSEGEGAFDTNEANEADPAAAPLLSFVERTAEAGLIGITGGLNLIQADYDNDGLRDVLLLRGAWRFDQGRQPNSLLRNLGGGRFEDVTLQAGLDDEWPTQTAAWADYDGDGFLDLYIGHESPPANVSGEEARRYGFGTGGEARPNALYRNNGDGTFTDVAEAVGLASVGFTKGVTWGDIDDDGDPDLFLSRMLQPNQLFRNDGPIAAGEQEEGGDGGGEGEGEGDTGAAADPNPPTETRAAVPWRFTDITAEAGVAEPIASFPAWFWDEDGDGRLDLFVAGYGDPADFLHESVGDVAADVLGLPAAAERPRMYRNRGDGRFEDVAAAAGVDDVLLAMGANYGDLDTDGRPDLYVGTGEPDYRALVPNRAYRNAGAGLFQDVTTSAGLGHLQKGHGVAFGDVDHDGDEDVYAVLGGALAGDWYPNAFFANPGPEAGRRWLSLDLIGTRSNRDAIGARIRVTVATPSGERIIHHLVGSGGTFGANSLRAEMGLGDATAVRDATVRWPGGATERFAGLALDGAYHLREGTGEAEAWARPSWRLPAAHEGHEMGSGAEGAGTSMAEPDRSPEAGTAGDESDDGDAGGAGDVAGTVPESGAVDAPIAGDNESAIDADGTSDNSP